MSVQPIAARTVTSAPTTASGLSNTTVTTAQLPATMMLCAYTPNPHRAALTVVASRAADRFGRHTILCLSNNTAYALAVPADTLTRELNSALPAQLTLTEHTTFGAVVAVRTPNTRTRQHLYIRSSVTAESAVHTGTATPAELVF